MAPDLDTNPVAAKRAKLAMPEVEAASRDELWRSNLRNDTSLSEVGRPEWWWTGKKPQDCPGYIKEGGYLASLPLPVRVWHMCESVPPVMNYSAYIQADVGHHLKKIKKYSFAFV
eukprot:8267558-Pyramimonas_sp.AAC.2